MTTEVHADTIPREAEVPLLLHLAPIEPDAVSRAAMLERVLARLRQPSGMLTIAREQGQWIELAPKVHQKILLSHAGTLAFLFRMEAGASFLAHEHHGDEESLCLEGEAFVDGHTIRRGDFHFAPRGLGHGVIHSPKGCLIYVRSSTPF